MHELLLGTALVLISLAVPVLTLWAEPRWRLIRWLSPVVVAYLVGMLFGNQPWVDFPDSVALGLCNVTVALAIPLLLFSVDILGWLRLARSTVLSFGLVALSVMISAACAHWLLAGRVDESPAVAGMLVGVYTGGTPNMAAIQTGLGARPETFILLNAADMIASFGYLLFILTLAVRLPAWLLPAFPRAQAADEAGEQEAARIGLPPWRSVWLGLALTALIVAVGWGAGQLVGESMRDAVVILVITTGAVLASLIPKVRAMRGTGDMGQFLLLVFCVSMGFTTDFTKLFAASPAIFGYVALTLFGAVGLHFGLAALLRIDRDTVVITSAAGIFGPHMVGPVVLALKNKEVLFSGLASGLVGYAVGNYLGMGLAWMLGG
ncbi:MAG: DUF819 family protein [Deltaproteobacteria bacterium]|nr:DUF819 family protein [Deltaproteobacteria bacterium]